MTRISWCGGPSRWSGVRLRSCLAIMLLPLVSAASCQPKVLTEIKPETILPPDISCSTRPAVPAIDAIAADNGDNILGAYIARLEAWGDDCEDAVKSYQKWRADRATPLTPEQ